jgi:predicted ATPase/DNA-binding winged helix-turn-helix (wHTH) protein
LTLNLLKRLLRQTDDEPIAQVSPELVMLVERPGLSSATRVLFGPFELNLNERILKRADEVIPLGARAFDILAALIDRAGEIVSKNELIAKVWPDVTVEEGSLRVHLSALRKALGEGQFGRKYITNIQGRGYSFVAPVARQGAKDHKTSSLARDSNLPSAAGRMIGRDDVVLQIRTRLQTERLITILGAGGIGKTTVALAVGHAASADFSDAVFFIDLSVLKSKDQVAAAMASALGLVVQSGDPEEAVLEFLRSRRALLILDSCEHLIEQTAGIADRICQCAPDVCLLATSREALQTAGEHVFRLQPLDYPPVQPGQTADEILAYPAARLFMERVSARGIDLALSTDDAPIVAEICHRLDGIPLAIELAAGRAAIFGLLDTVATLASRLDLLKLSRRTANPRHQTLRATLDWSHDLLSDVERSVLRRVAIFVGRFTLKAALTVAGQEGTDQSDVTDAVGSLVEKSLIGVRIDSQGASYRLLDTTRSYALEKLIASGEHDSIATQHANYLIQLLEADCFLTSKHEQSVEDYLGNVRAALEWSFGPGGGDALAIGLAAVAGPLFLALSLLVECRSWMEKAIDRMFSESNPQHRLEVHASFALSLSLTEGNSEKVRTAFHVALGFAERSGDSYQQLRLLSGFSMYFQHRADVAALLDLALRSEAVARKTGNWNDLAIANSLLGTAYYFLGDQARAQTHLEQALRDLPDMPWSIASQYMYAPRSLSLLYLARSHWLSGNLNRAVRYAEMTIEVADKSNHPYTLSSAVGMMTSLYFWIDDLRQVERNLVKLELSSEKIPFGPYRAVAQGLQGRYLLRTGRTAEGMRYLRDALKRLAVRRSKMLVVDFATELAVCLAKQNDRAEALTLIDEVIAGYAEVNVIIHLPALYLTKALAFVHGDVPDLQSAEAYLQRSMALAREQSALSYELRAGLVLAKIWIQCGEIQRARDLIRPVYSRFSEGFGTPDLILAREMLSTP